MTIAVSPAPQAVEIQRRAPLHEVDSEIWQVIQDETGRQRQNLELIASENFTSRAILEATGSTLTNKYAEGLPGRRYYGGCAVVDRAETLAIQRAKALFGAEHANVQAHSGSQANMAAYFAVLQPGDIILGMSLDQGGHLTHGSPRNFSGKLYRIVGYGVRRDTETIDYDEVAHLAAEHRPRLLLAGATAYPRIIDFPRLRAIADSVGALLMVDMAHIAGLVAAGLHPSPVPYADIVTSTTHKTLRGPRGGFILCRAAYAEAVDKAVMPGIQGGPLMHVIAAKAVCFREAATPVFAAYQTQIVANARALAAALAERGFRIVSGGTDNHMMLVDLTPRGLTGREAETVLDQAGITVNKNLVPFDTQKPLVTSGVRIGTPAVTTRGMQEPEMGTIAELIDRALTHRHDPAIQAEVRAAVHDLTARFPLYEEL
ncbi:MAG: serine hydroxymethyltransferase [Armatimonadetes bacterium]|nr:serine hydroxymethyltransferase [Armatimonadota bacterium]